MLYPLPSGFPSSESLEILLLKITGSEVETPTLLHACWEICGSGIHYFKGKAEDVPSFADGLSHSVAVEGLLAEVKKYEEDPKSMVLSPILLSLVVKIAFDLLVKYLKG